jgi:CIC family chloride channel protein
MFSVTSAPALTTEMFVIAIGLGIVVGFVSVVYIQAVTAAPGWGRSSRVPLAWRPLIPATFLFLISPAFPHLLGTGLNAVDLALTGKIGLFLLVCLVVLKIIATSLCLGFGMFGGVFAPALFIGALTGSIFDSLLGGIVPAGSSFAILGAACCIAAVIGAPMASIVIVFELTGSYEWAVLAMVSVVVSQQISRALAGRSLFDRQLESRGVYLTDDHPPDPISPPKSNPIEHPKHP